MKKEIKDLEPVVVASSRQLVSWTRREIKTSDELIRLFREYFEESGNGVLSLAGFATFLGTSPFVFIKLKEIFPDQFGFIKQAIEKTIIERTLCGDYNASFAQFLLRNRFDYSEADVQINQFSTSADDIKKIKQSLREMREKEE